MASAQDIVTLTANCLCKANVFTTQVPKSNLPLEGRACHCTSCRKVTGALNTMVAPWPEPRANVDVSKLKAYAFSPKYDFLFCGTCSTPMFFANSQEHSRELVVLTGTLKSSVDDLVKITKHIFVGDTKDGGASMWMRKLNSDGKEAKRYKGRAENEKGEPAEAIPYDWPPSKELTGFEARKEGPVPIRCRCEGVNLIWNQGSYDGKKEDELPWFVDPVTHKALAGFCACESCRLFGGTDLWTWGFAELKDLDFLDEGKQPRVPALITDLQALVDAKDPSIGTLMYYSSSSEVKWYFCGNCSACVFYAWEGRPNMVDVALGVLEASDGARAEGSFSWAYGGGVSHLEEDVGSWRFGLWQRALQEGEEWRIGRGYPKNWRRVARELKA